MNFDKFKNVDELDSNQHKFTIFNQAHLFNMRIVTQPKDRLNKFYNCEICNQKPSKNPTILFFFIYKYTRLEFKLRFNLIANNDCICESCITQLIEDSDSFILKYNLGLI